MSTIKNLNKAAKQYCEEIASIDIQSGAINGGMKTIYSYQGLKAAFIAGAKWQREQSPWISVEEKLPAENEGVFFVIEWVDHGKGYFVGLYENGYWESDHRIFLSNSQIGKVTHWMPIPPQ